MKTKTLFLIGVLVAFVTISSQLKPQEMSFYKKDGNYVVDRGYLIKEVKKLSDPEIKTIMELNKGLQSTVRSKSFGKLNVAKYSIGCYDKIDINIKKYADMKVMIDKIMKKYNAQQLAENYYSIQNNQVVTNAVMLKQSDIATLGKLSVRGADEYSICPDIMGKTKLTNVIVKVTRGNGIDPRINVKLNNILAGYK